MARKRTPARFSRGVPYALSETQQKNFLLALENDEIRNDLETVMHKDLASMSIQEQIAAFREYVDSGFGLALASQVATARKELRELAREERQEIAKDDKIKQLEMELAHERVSRERAERTIDLMDAEALAEMTKPIRSRA